MSAESFPPPLHIILFAALPQETAAFKKKTGPWRRLPHAPGPAWQHSGKDRSLFLVETGMGERRLKTLFEWATSLRRCDLLVSFGFGGGLTPELGVGALCLCDRFLRWNPQEHTIEVPGVQIDGLKWEEALRVAHRVRNCVDVTTPRMVPKADLGLHLPAGSSPALVDMESHCLANLARAASTPFVVLRAISDTLDHELDFDLSSIADDTGSLQIRKLADAFLRKPTLIKSFVQLWHDSRKAGRILGEAVATLTTLPHEQLEGILRTSCVRNWKG